MILQDRYILNVEIYWEYIQISSVGKCMYDIFVMMGDMLEHIIETSDARGYSRVYAISGILGISCWRWEYLQLEDIL